MINRIIDISHWQQNIDWTKLKNDGVDGVYIKCTGYNFQDPMCLTHANNAKAQGMAVGYYHFANPDQDPSAQAQAFIAQLAKMPLADLMPVLDIETDTSVNVQQWIEAFFSAFVSPMMLYSYQPYLDAHNVSLNCPLWIAQYRTTLTLPKGWSAADLWQFSNHSVVDAVPGGCDEDKPLTQNFVYQPGME